jgi:hypothetical protein
VRFIPPPDPHSPSRHAITIQGANRATPNKQVGGREESVPPDTWTESGQTSIVGKVSSSRD